MLQKSALTYCCYQSVSVHLFCPQRAVGCTATKRDFSKVLIKHSKQGEQTTEVKRLISQSITDT